MNKDIIKKTLEGKSVRDLVLEDEGFLPGEPIKVYINNDEDLEQFQNTEVHGVANIDGNEEQVEDNEAEYFTLFGHLKAGGLDTIADYKTREEAEAAARAVDSKLIGGN